MSAFEANVRSDLPLKHLFQLKRLDFILLHIDNSLAIARLIIMWPIDVRYSCTAHFLGSSNMPYRFVLKSLALFFSISVF